MAAATKPKVDAGAAFLQSIAANNPANTPLQAGLHADPTYLAFLRGIGYSYDQATRTAFEQMESARAAYHTQASRLPEQLRAAQEQTDAGAMDRGVFASGERLQRENRNVVTNQQQGQDLLSARATAMSGAQQTLQGAIAELQRQRADAEGDLQNRIQQRADQDRYIKAVGGANSGGGGGSVSFSVGGGGGTPAQPAPAQPAVAPAPKTPTGANAGRSANQSTAAMQPALAPGQDINGYLSSRPLLDYLGALNPSQQQQFFAFTQAQYPNADFSVPLRYIAAQSTGGVSTGGASRAT